MAYFISENLERQFIGNKCSLAFYFCVVLYVIGILLPFFLAFSTNNFWLNTKVYYEQPTVNFRNEIIVFVNTDSGTKAYSSIKSINELIQSKISAPTTKVHQTMMIFSRMTPWMIITLGSHQFVLAKRLGSFLVFLVGSGAMECLVCSQLSWRFELKHSDFSLLFIFLIFPKGL